MESVSFIQELVRGNNQFAINLYLSLSAPEDNIFFSPFTISNSLAMIFAGARGETEEALKKTLRFTLHQDELHLVFSDLIEGIKSRWEKGGYQILIAHRLWGQKGTDFETPFLLCTKNHYAKAFKDIDFTLHPAEVREAINGWVAQKTARKITDLVPKQVIDSDTKMLLTNAVYFKNSWHRQFDEHTTQELPFSTSRGETVKVPTMFVADFFPYAETPEMQVLELHFRRGDMSMLILLPREQQNLDYIEMQLSAADLDLLIPEMKREKVVVYLPKFTLTSPLSMKSVLAKMGIGEIFTSDTNLGGIGGNVYLSDLYHQAMIEIDEKGAATQASDEATWILKGGAPPEYVFRANRPFMFLIKDNINDSILFVGRVNNPAGK